MNMPFGKYAGEELDDIPSDYLEWMVNNLDERPKLQKEAEEILAMRAGKGVVRKRDT